MSPLNLLAFSLHHLINRLDQESANYSLWAKSGLPLVFVSKVLLEPSHTHFSKYCLWLQSSESSPERPASVENLKYFPPGPFKNGLLTLRLGDGESLLKLQLSVILYSCIIFSSSKNENI
jgi:hypothetical protein